MFPLTLMPFNTGVYENCSYSCVEETILTESGSEAHTIVKIILLAKGRHAYTVVNRKDIFILL